MWLNIIIVFFFTFSHHFETRTIYIADIVHELTSACSVLMELELHHFNASIVVHMNNGLHKSQIGQSHLPRGHNGTQCVVLPQGGRKVVNITLSNFSFIQSTHCYILMISNLPIYRH